MVRWPRSSPANALLAAVCLSLASNHSAHAYIDPGTGSYIFQLLIGMGLASAYLVKVYWQRILGFFSKKSGEGEDER